MVYRMADETLKDVIHDIEVFKEKNVEQVRLNINNEISTLKKDIPQELNTDEFDLKIQKEIDDAVRFAEESPYPAEIETVQDIYTDLVEEGRIR